LEAALANWNISVRGKIAADLGASTGGFSDCLLQRGARRVYAVDVDTRQLDWNLRNDSRIILIKKNARYLDTCDFPEAIDLVVMDLSFISVLKVLPAVKNFLKNGILLVLIKPQFEVGKGEVGKKGIVRDPVLHQEVLLNIINEAGVMGFFIKGLMKTPILGQKGNQEFFVLWSQGPKLRVEAEVKTLIQEVVGHEKN
jgi:23S rRNA (cytidine1920-2'-O)/16S rRNA (cytidine1409-2'-O)-methyltransferase